MKTPLILLLGVSLSAGACVPYVAGPPGPPPPPAPYLAGPTVGVAIGVEDRPYYVHGPAYYVGRRHYVWRSGHYIHRHGRRVWEHGRYVSG